MLLWIVMALLAAAASLAVLVPLARAGRTGSAAGPALSIYRDQMSEVDRDLGRGLIAESEAEAARTEIGRRLIRAGIPEVVKAAGRRSGPRIAAVVAIAAPVLALGIYLALGSPDLPDQPLAARLSTPLEQQDVAALVARVEAHLATNPEDGAGWEVIGPVYLRMGRYDDAVRAFGNALRLLGSNAERETALGDALVRASNGLITADARAAFERANRLAPQAIAPRFYLAVALSQDGRKDDAIAAWQALLKGAPAGAAWVPLAERWVAQLQGTAAPPPASATPAQPGPNAADVQAAGDMTPEQRVAMINGMVGQLAARLDSNPDDAEGWARLVRSYMVLGRAEDAKAALAKARTALAGKSDRLAVVEAEARSAGLE